MPIYKERDRYVVKVSIQGKQVFRRKYLGRTMINKEQAIKCERDLIIQYNELNDDYEINNLFGLFEDYLFKKYKETSVSTNITVFNKHIKVYFAGRKISDITRSYLVYINDKLNNIVYKDVHKLIFVSQMFIDFLSLYGLNTSSNALFSYKKNKIKHKVYNYYSLEEFNKLIKVIKEPLYILLLRRRWWKLLNVKPGYILMIKELNQ